MTRILNAKRFLSSFQFRAPNNLSKHGQFNCRNYTPSSSDYVSDWHQWDFSKQFIKFNRRSWNINRSGFLQQNCDITVHDYGASADGKVTYQINGKDYSPRPGVDPSDENRVFEYDDIISATLDTPDAITCRGVDDMLSKFPEGFFETRPPWGRTRWIDIEGRNGEIIQYFLRLSGCERRYIFNNIVDTKQRSMGILLESPHDSRDVKGDKKTNDNTKNNILKYLLVTKVGSLREGVSWTYHDRNMSAKKDAVSENDENENRIKALLSRRDALSSKSLRYEHVSHLLCVDHSHSTQSSSSSSASTEQPAAVNSETSGKRGTVITFQEGIKIGRAFENVRDRIRNDQSKIHRRGAVHLLMQLVRASTESVLSIEHYIEEALDRLQMEVREDPYNIELVNFAKQIEIECETLQRVMEPFTETLVQMTGRDASISSAVLGHNRAAWENITLQQKRIHDNIEGEQQRAIDIVEGYRDAMTRKEEQRQQRIENSQRIMNVVLSVFSPLAFIAGVYGMNFQTTDGAPAIPELTWGFAAGGGGPTGWITGYTYFWLLSVTVSMTTLYLYRKMGLLDGIRLRRTIGSSSHTTSRRQHAAAEDSTGSRGSLNKPISPHESTDSSSSSSK